MSPRAARVLGAIVLTAAVACLLAGSAGCVRNADGSWAPAPRTSTSEGQAYTARQVYNEALRTLDVLARAGVISDEQDVAIDVFVKAARAALAEWDAANEMVRLGAMDRAAMAARTAAARQRFDDALFEWTARRIEAQTASGEPARKPTPNLEVPANGR